MISVNWKLCIRKIFTNLFVNVNMLVLFFIFSFPLSLSRTFIAMYPFTIWFVGFNLCWTYGSITIATSAFYIDLRTTTSIKHETTGTNNIRSSKFFGRLSRFATQNTRQNGGMWMNFVGKKSKYLRKIEKSWEKLPSLDIHLVVGSCFWFLVSLC